MKNEQDSKSPANPPLLPATGSGVPRLRPIPRLLDMIEALGDADDSMRTYGVVDPEFRFRELRMLMQELRLTLRQNSD